MEIIYDTVAHFEEEMKSGLMREKLSEIHMIAWDIHPLIKTLNKSFKTNLNVGEVNFSELDLLIWPPDEESEPNSFQITLNEHFSSVEREVIIKQILARMNEHPENVEQIRITRDCEVDLTRVECLLNKIKDGDVFENILENIPKLCFIDAKTYQSKEIISQMIDEFEEILFEELINKKIRVNGKAGMLKEVQGDCRYGFFERGVRKDYACLSLVQKMGAKTIRQIGFEIDGFR